MIPPTVGRVVWYYPNPETKEPWDAHIVKVHSDTHINIAGFDPEGEPYKVLTVQIVQDEMDFNPLAPQGYCRWMPYQIGQAKK